MDSPHQELSISFSRKKVFKYYLLLGGGDYRIPAKPHRPTGKMANWGYSSNNFPDHYKIGFWNRQPKAHGMTIYTNLRKHRYLIQSII
ncbi:hypothetical protein OUZ56_029421 [Daphnia magna]|uniref:Uncharacterized protein n=1 Tax=Daphnia magna TaxID=35525 RepID=A0ABR0B6S7_9CRUS|nr:hypothetical protein OUZ56_029421 [Daphnia magna]